MIRKATQPSEDWTYLLQNLVEEICRDDYNWTRPNPRYVKSGIYLPVLASDGMPDLLIIVDTSGSMNTEQLKQIMAEIRRILEIFMCRVIVLYVDDQVQGFEEFEGHSVRAGNFTLNAQGNGGTKFAPAFEWFENNHEIDPAAIIYFTDLQCPTSEWEKLKEPEVPMIWGHILGPYSSNDRYKKRVTFGEVVDINLPRGT